MKLLLNVLILSCTALFLVLCLAGPVTSADYREKKYFESSVALKEYLLAQPNLAKLELNGCPGIAALPDLPDSLTQLKINNCKSLKSLPLLPKSLKILSLSGCPVLERLPTLPPSLTWLQVIDCDSLTALPQLPASITFLQVISEPSSLTKLPPLPNSLSELLIGPWPGLEALPELPDSLTSLVLNLYCSRITALPSLPKSLTKLSIEHCPALKSLPSLPTSLTKLEIWGCPEIKNLPPMPDTLNSLLLASCPGLTSLPQLPPTLTDLKVMECPGLVGISQLKMPLMFKQTRVRFVALPEGRRQAPTQKTQSSQVVLALMQFKTLLISGKFEEAEFAANKLLSEAGKAGGNQGNLLILCQLSVADFYIATGRISKAEELLHKALVLTQNTESQKPLQVETLERLAAIELGKDNHKKTLDFIDKAIELNRAITPRNNDRTAKLLGTRGQFLAAQMQMQSALGEYQRALNLLDENSNVQTRAGLIHGISQVYAQIGEIDKAYVTNKEALRLAEQSTDPFNPRACAYLTDLAGLAIRLGNWSEAAGYVQRAIQLESSHSRKPTVRLAKLQALSEIVNAHITGAGKPGTGKPAPN